MERKKTARDEINQILMGTPAKKKTAKTAKKKTAKKAKKKTAKKKTGPSQAEIAARLSKALGGPVTRQQVREWVAKGYDLKDTKSLIETLLAQRTCPDWLTDRHALCPPGDSERPTAAELKYQFLLERVRKTCAEADLKELEATAAKENWITAAFAGETGRQIGAIFRAAHVTIEQSWPAMLVGLTEAKMRKKIRPELNRIFEEIRRFGEEKGVKLGVAGKMDAHIADDFFMASKGEP